MHTVLFSRHGRSTNVLLLYSQQVLYGTYSDNKIKNTSVIYICLIIIIVKEKNLNKVVRGEN